MLFRYKHLVYSYIPCKTCNHSMKKICSKAMDDGIYLSQETACKNETDHLNEFFTIANCCYRICECVTRRVPV